MTRKDLLAQTDEEKMNWVTMTVNGVLPGRHGAISAGGRGTALSKSDEAEEEIRLAVVPSCVLRMAGQHSLSRHREEIQEALGPGNLAAGRKHGAGQAGLEMQLCGERHECAGDLTADVENAHGTAEREASRDGCIENMNHMAGHLAWCATNRRW